MMIDSNLTDSLEQMTAANYKHKLHTAITQKDRLDPGHSSGLNAWGKRYTHAFAPGCDYLEND